MSGFNDTRHVMRTVIEALQKVVQVNAHHDDLFEVAAVRDACANLCEAIRRDHIETQSLEEIQE